MALTAITRYTKCLMNKTNNDMLKKPEILMTDIPTTSPYYDKLRSLKLELDFVPYGSPEYRNLRVEIANTEKCARKKMETDNSIMA